MNCFGHQNKAFNKKKYVGLMRLEFCFHFLSLVFRFLHQGVLYKANWRCFFPSIQLDFQKVALNLVNWKTCHLGQTKCLMFYEMS
jgi:hypothetical protein